jgi:hypothetical protein
LNIVLEKKLVLFSYDFEMSLKQCISFDESLITNFSDGFINNKTITFQPIGLAPYVMYTENDNYYEVCGPMVMLLKELSIRQKSL